MKKPGRSGRGNSGGATRAPKRVDAPDTASEKLQKVLAQEGLASRRELEAWIKAGRVEVNGEPAHLGQRVVRTDRIEVDGKAVSIGALQATEILVLNKAAGIVCTRKDEEGRRTVFEDLPRLPHGRWITVGRLDIQTTGLLLLTNDGALAHRMMHPSTGLDREYAVRINKKLEDEDFAVLREGVEIDGENLHFSDIQYFNGSGINHWYHVVIMEGRNREVRRLFDYLGCTVSRLKRVRFGPVILPSWLRSGQWTSMQEADVNALGELLGVNAQAAVKVKRSKVAKTSCLIPYPALGG